VRPLDQIILAAADVDQDTFRNLSVAYAEIAHQTTMYVCSKDLAVEASHSLHDYPRAGLTPPVLVVDGIDTINVSNLDLTGLARLRRGGTRTPHRHTGLNPKRKSARETIP
jgi:esterase/lipase superfamily enzyme